VCVYAFYFDLGRLFLAREREREFSSNSTFGRRWNFEFAVRPAGRMNCASIQSGRMPQRKESTRKEKAFGASETLHSRSSHKHISPFDVDGKKRMPNDESCLRDDTKGIHKEKASQNPMSSQSLCCIHSLQGHLTSNSFQQQQQHIEAASNRETFKN